MSVGARPSAETPGPGSGPARGPDPPLGGPRQILSAVLHRLLHPRPIVLETRRPIEVPVLTEVKRLWQNGEKAASIRLGYVTVLADVQRAFGVQFPEDWTHEDILERGVTQEMVPIPDFLHKFLSLYAPLRYGSVPPEDLPSPEPILQSIYSHPKMWGLYLAEVPRPDVDPRRLAPSDVPPSLEPGSRA